MGKKRATAQRPPQNTIRGAIMHIRFRNEAQWTVGVLRTSDGDEHNFTCTMPDVGVGDEVELTGEFVDNRTYGVQFKAGAFRVVQPMEAEGVVRFLSSKLKHVGRRRALAIVEHFGAENVWDVFENAPGRLVEIDGITPARAQQIVEDYAASRAMRDTLVWLQGYRMTDWQASKVLEMYGTEAKDVLTEDPYRLIEDIHGFGFRTVDFLARKMGADRQGQPRARAAAITFLREKEDAGDVFQPVKQFCVVTAKELSVPVGVVQRAVHGLIKGGQFVHDDGRLYTAEMYGAETQVAGLLLGMRDAPTATAQG